MPRPPRSTLFPYTTLFRSQKLAQQQLSEESSEILPSAMRIARYFNEMARLSGLIVDYSERFSQISDSNTQKDIYDLKKITTKMLDAAMIDDDSDISSSETRKVLHKLENKYQKIKQHVLDAMIAGRLSPDEGTDLLDSLSHIHRLGEQAEKSSRYWSSLSPIKHRSPVKERPEPDVMEPQDIREHSEEPGNERTETTTEAKKTERSSDEPVALN